MEHTIILAATISVLIFGIIGIIDGFYYHIWKFKLYKHPETKFEHLTHSIRTLLFLGMLFLFFLNDYGGKTLLIGVSLVILDLIVLLIDLIVEKDSRRNLGGLPHIEYIIHVIANALHFLAIGLILVAKPLAYWSLTAPTIIDRDYPDLTRLVAENLIPGTALLVIVHFVLMNKKVATIFENLMDKIAKKIN